jgi:LuxR family maltose regulon positive regulatory protein
LVERLNAGLHRKLTLISAPAGFGKTTLVSEWVHSGVGSRAGWLSLDESDNDPTRFLTYLVAAVQAIEASIGIGLVNALQSPQPPPAEAILTATINEMTACPDRMVLVLDDYHLVEAQSIHDALTFLLRHLPVNLHLVIATREDPPLSLAGLRARGQLTELRATDLRFTSAEAAEFLNQMMGLDLSAEDVVALERRTEGWIAGLQLAAISMRGRKDVTGFIRSFTGSHHYVLDYLLEEVLEQQSESVQTFLLQTAVLDRLTGPLCDALTGQSNGHATLAMLEHANLFVVPLDEEQCWYRYHHLFADLLRQRLRQNLPLLSSPSVRGTEGEIVPELHARASAWYEQNEFADDAIEHALRAEDFERAADLIKEHADVAWQRGEHAKLRRWLAGLPDALLCAKPQLCIYQAWYLFAGGQQDAGERSLQVAEAALEPRADRVPEPSSPDQAGQQIDTERAKLRGRAAVIRASMASYRGDVPGIIQHARRALVHLPKQDLAMRSAAAISLGNAYGFKGDMAAAYQARLEAVEASRSGGNTYFSIVAHLEVAITLREQGWLQRTIEICRQQVQVAIESGLSHVSVTGCLLAIWGEALAEQGDLEGAQRQTEKGVERTEGGDLAMLGWSNLCRIRVLFSAGDMAAVQEIVQKIEHIARQRDVPPWIVNQMAAWQARLWLAQGKLEAAAGWVRERALDAGGEPRPAHEMDYFTLIEYVVLARILIAQGQLDEADKLLQLLLEAARAGDRTTRAIEILNLRALAFQARTDTPRATAALERALALAQPGGFFRTFVDEGPPMARLLERLRRKGVAVDFTNRILAALETTDDRRPATDESPSASSVVHRPPAPARAPSSVVEPLSRRELEVLQLIAEGLTNAEIASRLYLSLNTIKVHTRNVYGKLGVHSRTQAVARARALGVLPSI